MKIITARNVNDAFSKGLMYLYDFGKEEPSRNGPVLVAPCPVTTVYTHPTERVLFSPMRDANPFFHLMEALWMMAGRNDVAWPAYFASGMTQFSDDGETLHGAYGYRWRSGLGFDQLEVIAAELKANPASRRCVLQMWECTPEPSCDCGWYFDDLRKAMSGGKDVPCNTHIYFRVVEKRLDMTVLCRSNDIIWGAYGANAVHFSVLQEVMAVWVGVEVGTYYQVSNNYHLYLEKYPRQLLPQLALDASRFDYSTGMKLYPLVSSEDAAEWLQDAEHFLENPADYGCYTNYFFDQVARPMYISWLNRKNKLNTGEADALSIRSHDWRLACQDWILRREDAKNG